MIALGLILVFFSMIFSASESAFLSINKLRLRVRRLKNDKRAIRVWNLLEHRDMLLNTFLLGNNIVNITITALITAFVLALFRRLGIFASSEVSAAALLATVFLLIFGEIMPKTIGARYPEQTAFLLSGIIALLVKLLSPLTLVFTRISRLLAKLMGIPLETGRVSFTAEEIKSFIDIGEEEGVLESGEKRMMHRVFAFADLAAKDIMTPRTKIVALSLFATYRDVLELAQRSRFSCFPVCRDGMDDVAGTLYLKDMLALGDDPAGFSIKAAMREPVFIPGTKKISSVQQTLREKNQSMAIIMDEYSGTGGLLTTQDIAEAIFGKISGSREGRDKPLVTALSRNELIADGSCRLTELAEREGIVLHSKHYETLGGFVLEKCDRIPQIGDAVSNGGHTFTVMAVNQNRVQKIHITRKEPLVFPS
ncbi:MAG: hemolysin family protein [Treponema sp.]|jgi:putative hemolysin|nr:hemolysin family protein [Treponema sp.]